MHGAEALSGAIDAGQQLLRGDLAVSYSWWRQAIVAIAATDRAECFAEIAEQAAAPAMRGFGKPDQRIQLAKRYALEGVGRFRFLDHAALLHDIGQTISHPGTGRLAVASRATGLLIIGLDTFRQVEMRDKAHVWFVDAHAEGDGCHHDDAVLVEEAVLMAGADCGVETGMIGQGRDTGVAKRAGDILDLGA